jgi:hypothetical protein
VVSEPLLPDVTSDEGDVGWGDHRSESADADRDADHDDRDNDRNDDSRLTDERPPHHDRP